MDKYLVRKPREQPAKSSISQPKKRMRQATIESLQGVVIVEEIYRQKAQLKVPDQSSENLLAALVKLDEKIPSRDILQKTKIGHTVNRLTKHADKEVAAAAGQLVNKWKKHFQEKLDRPMIEVKCDKRTEELRKNARKMITSALQLPERHALGESIEREAYVQHNRRAGPVYRRCVRTLVFGLRGQEELRQRVTSRDLHVTQLVTMHMKHTPTPSTSSTSTSSS